jgi:hypothetical protein
MPDQRETGVECPMLCHGFGRCSMCGDTGWLIPPMRRVGDVFGLPAYVDPTLPPDEIRLVDRKVE